MEKVAKCFEIALF